MAFATTTVWDHWWHELMSEAAGQCDAKPWIRITIWNGRVERALVAHNAVAEPAVIGFPHDVKGQGIYALVTMRQMPVGKIHKLWTFPGIH